MRHRKEEWIWKFHLTFSLRPGLGRKGLRPWQKLLARANRIFKAIFHSFIRSKIPLKNICRECPFPKLTIVTWEKKKLYSFELVSVEYESNFLNIFFKRKVKRGDRYKKSSFITREQYGGQLIIAKNKEQKKLVGVILRKTSSENIWETIRKTLTTKCDCRIGTSSWRLPYFPNIFRKLFNRDSKITASILSVSISIDYFHELPYRFLRPLKFFATF